MLDINEVVDTLQNRPDGLEIIITGRAAPCSLVRISQLHSEMRPRLTGNLSTQTRQSSSNGGIEIYTCLLYTSPSPRDLDLSRMPSSA